jgi:hypothetical protein
LPLPGEKVGAVAVAVVIGVAFAACAKVAAPLAKVNAIDCSIAIEIGRWHAPPFKRADVGRHAARVSQDVDVRRLRRQCLVDSRGARARSTVRGHEPLEGLPDRRRPVGELAVIRHPTR